MDWKSASRVKNGFTFIELLITSSIMAVVIISLYSVFHTGLLTYRKIDRTGNLYRATLVVLSLLENDIGNSFGNTEEDSGFFGGEDYLWLYALVPVYDNAGGSRVYPAKINYATQNQSAHRMVLKGFDYLSSLTQEGQMISALLENISFQYAYDEKNGNYLWQSIWPKPGDDQQRMSLPLAVKTRITLKDRADEKASALVVTRIIPLRFGEVENE